MSTRVPFTPEPDLHDTTYVAGVGEMAASGRYSFDPQEAYRLDSLDIWRDYGTGHGVIVLTLYERDRVYLPGGNDLDVETMARRMISRAWSHISAAASSDRLIDAVSRHGDA